MIVFSIIILHMTCFLILSNQKRTNYSIWYRFCSLLFLLWIYPWNPFKWAKCYRTCDVNSSLLCNLLLQFCCGFSVHMGVSLSPWWPLLSLQPTASYCDWISGYPWWVGYSWRWTLHYGNTICKQRQRDKKKKWEEAGGWCVSFPPSPQQSVPAESNSREQP